jgi:hypothetical protein
MTSMEERVRCASFILSRTPQQTGQCTWRAIAEAKQHSQWLVIIYYLEFLRASEGTLSHLRQVLAAFAVISTHASFKKG